MTGILPFLARRRVLIGFIAGLAAIWWSRPTRQTLLIGAIIAVLGEAIRIWAAGHLEKGREVTSSGPYRFTRHPLYLGSTIIGAGLAIASASVIVAVLVALYLAVTLSAAIATEEAHRRRSSAARILPIAKAVRPAASAGSAWRARCGTASTVP